MKKHEAMEEMERAGQKINDLHASAWNAALHPTRHGWAASIFSIASIPVLGAASIGAMIGNAVAKQGGAEVIERLTESPPPRDDKK